MAERFDEYHADYGAVVQDSVNFTGLRHDFFLEAKARLIRRLVATRLGQRPQDALDVGCGVGALHPFLRGAFASLSGCDISADSIARARADNGFVDYTSYQAPSLPYGDARFDVTFASCVVHHVPPAAWPGFFAEMRRVTRPGGLSMIIEHNPINPLTRLAVLRCPFDDDAVLLGARKVRRLFEGAGFRAVAAEHFLLLPSAARPARAIERAFSGLPFGAQYVSSALA